MITAQRFVLLLLIISLLAGMMTGQQLYYRLGYLWGFLLIGSWAMSALALRGIEMRRRPRALRSQVGQIFEERYEIRNTTRFLRLWIEVRDQSPLPGSSGSHVVTLIGGRESRTYLARTRLVERGVFPLGPTVLASGDLFGLFPVTRIFPSHENLLVFPMLFPVRDFLNPPGLLPGGEALRRRTAQITSNAYGVREYEAGDPLNRIHWLSTARRSRLMVKEFELDPLADIWIFVDAESSVQAARKLPRQDIDPQDVWRRRIRYELPPDTIEYAVSIAASLARFYLQRGRAVGLVSAGPHLRILPSDRGGRQLGKMLESLAVIRSEGIIPIQGLVETHARHLPRGSTVIMITPDASTAVYQTADMLLQRGLRPVMVLIDRDTFGGKPNGQEVIQSLGFLGVSVCRVAYQDDLPQVVSDAVSRSGWGG